MKLHLIPHRKHVADARDATVRDAAWRRLSNTQKARLSMLARKAYGHQKVQGMDLDEWRQEVAVSACGVRISEATQEHWAALKAAFLDLAGEPEAAFRTHVREGDNRRRIAMHKLREALEAGGLEMEYAAKICRDVFKCNPEQASAGQLWKLVFTIRHRSKRKK